jgi:transposase-like protein
MTSCRYTLLVEEEASGKNTQKPWKEEKHTLLSRTSSILTDRPQLSVDS